MGAYSLGAYSLGAYSQCDRFGGNKSTHLFRNNIEDPSTYRLFRENADLLYLSNFEIAISFDDVVLSFGCKSITLDNFLYFVFVFIFDVC